MKNCYLCKGKLVNDTSTIRYNNKSATIIGERCTKCNEFFSSLEETDRARKLLNPTFFEKIMKVFG